MGKLILERVQKTLIVLLLVSLVVLTTASATACSSAEKAQTPCEKGAYAKSMAEEASGGVIEGNG